MAYVSYNTYPGWHIRGMIRDMMCYHTRQFSDPTPESGKPGTCSPSWSSPSAEQTAPYGMLLRDELQVLNRMPTATSCTSTWRK